MKTVIHKTPYNILLREFPYLEHSSEMRVLTSMLLFSPWIDEETGAVRVGAEILARAVGKNHLVIMNPETGKKTAPNFKAKTVLDVFMNHIMPEGSCELLDYIAFPWVLGDTDAIFMDYHKRDYDANFLALSESLNF